MRRYGRGDRHQGGRGLHFFDGGLLLQQKVTRFRLQLTSYTKRLVAPATCIYPSISTNFGTVPFGWF